MEFRKITSTPASSGLADALFFVRLSSQDDDKVFDLYVAGQDGSRNTLDRIAVKRSSGGVPHANPRHGDQWHDTVTDHMFVFMNNGVGNYWIDVA